MSANDLKQAFAPLQADTLSRYDEAPEAVMRRCEFSKLANRAISIWSGLATTFLAGALSITSPTTGDSGEAKKPIHIGVISFAEPALRTHLDQSLIRGLREQGYVEGTTLLSSGATPTVTEAAFRRPLGISPE